MPLPDDTIWYLIVNGHDDRSPLQLVAVEPDGSVRGTISTSGNRDAGIPLEEGFWNEDARELTFKVTLENGEVQTYTGFLFDQAPSGVKVPIPLPGVQYGLAGTFVGDRFEDVARPGFGWFALGAHPIE